MQILRTTLLQILQILRETFFAYCQSGDTFFAKCDQSSQDGHSAWVRPGYAGTGSGWSKGLVWSGESVSLENMHSENIWLTGSEPSNTCVLCPWII